MNTNITPSASSGIQGQSQEANRDLGHLRLLSIFHYVAAGIAGFFSCLPFMHIAFGLLIILAPESFKDVDSGETAPALVGWFLVGIGSAVVLAGWTLTILLIVAGRFLKRLKRRIFCMVVAGISCLFMPVGTVLGVFTIIVLSRPTVRALFEAKERPRTL